MTRWLIPLGLAATVAGLIYYEHNKKKKDDELVAIKRLSGQNRTPQQVRQKLPNNYRIGVRTGQ